MVKLAGFKAKHGVKVQVLNRGRAPVPEPLSEEELRKRAGVEGSQWSAYRFGTVYVVTVEVER